MPNHTVPFISIPVNALPAKTPSDALRALVATAFAQKLPIKLIDTAGVIRKSIFVPPVLDARVEQLAKQHEWSYPDTFAALCAAALVELMASRAEIIDARSEVIVPFDARPGQDVFYKSLIASVQRGRVCLAEASTGIGKSRSLIAAAIETAQDGKKPVVIAAPTLAVLGNSLWKEYEGLHQSGMGLTCKVRFFPGASEFINRDRLHEYLNEAVYQGEPVDEAVKQWVDAGCPVLNETPLTRAMQKSGRTLRCLMSDLRDLATQLDPTAFAFKKADPGNDGIRSLLEIIRADAVNADIIFCTHAMLTMAKQGGWEWFPKPSVLMIDEAHLLEGIVASASSDNLSLFAFRHSVRVARKAANLGASSAAGKLEAALKNLIFSAKTLDQGATGIRLDASISSNALFVGALTQTADCLKAKTLTHIPRIKEARNSIAIAIGAIESAVNAFGRLEYSPDRRFPSLLVGKRSVASILGALWSDAEGGVVLASASLSTPDEFGNTKFDYIAGLLALPISRLDTPNPVTAPWVTSIPVLHLPLQPDTLSRPHRAIRTDAMETQWLTCLAEQITSVATNAKGGTLVLMTSYLQVAALTTILKTAGLDERVVTQSPDEKFAVCEGRFRASYRAGKRPILLGLGVAWTGVDLTDKDVPESQDNLLTDLIVGCLPIGLNKSSTMAARIEKQGVNPIIKESLMIFLQGLGRCVRSGKATNKHIWLMDGRLWTNWPGMGQLQKSARRIMERYSKQESFATKAK